VDEAAIMNAMVAMFVDGIHLGGHVVVVALGVRESGDKEVVGLWEGSTENTVVCTSLLTDLIERGLDTRHSLLWVIDGSKALRKAIGDVMGEAALVQRCQVHKIRNVMGHLPEAQQRWT